MKYQREEDKEKKEKDKENWGGKCGRHKEKKQEGKWMKRKSEYEDKEECLEE